MKFSKIIIYFSVVFLLFSCGKYKPLSDGSSIEIITLSSESVWEAIRPDLKPKVERIIRTPQREELFYFSPVDLVEFQEHKNDMIVFMAAALNKNDKITNYIKKGLDESIIRKVKSGEKYFYYEYDKTARRQTYILLLAPDMETLKLAAQQNAQKMYDVVNKGFLDSQFRQIYARAEEKELSGEIYQKLDFSFRIPHDYEIIELDTARQILHLGVARPQRNIIVYWQDGGFNKVLSRKWALQTKQWVMNYQMEGIYFEDNYLRYRSVDWGGLIVNNIRGLWGHPKKTMGGPFSFFYFYDGVTDRTYFIDCIVYAPGRSKAVYLRQMEIMASTFYTSK